MCVRAAAATETANCVLPDPAGLEQQRFLQLGGEKDYLSHYRVDEVAGGCEFGREIVDRIKHRFVLAPQV
jgi:hypothetical protein